MLTQSVDPQFIFSNLHEKSLTKFNLDLKPKEMIAPCVFKPSKFSKIIFWFSPMKKNREWILTITLLKVQLEIFKFLPLSELRMPAYVKIKSSKLQLAIENILLSMIFIIEDNFK